MACASCPIYSFFRGVADLQFAALATPLARCDTTRQLDGCTIRALDSGPARPPCARRSAYEKAPEISGACRSVEIPGKRARRIELPTYALGTRRSTAELRPRPSHYTVHRGPVKDRSRRTSRSIESGHRLCEL